MKSQIRTFVNIAFLVAFFIAFMQQAIARHYVGIAVKHPPDSAYVLGASDALAAAFASCIVVFLANILFPRRVLQ